MMLDLRKVILSKSYLDEFDSTVMNLSNLNVSLHENLATKLWCSLPKDSKHFRETEVITLTEAKSAL